MLCFFSGFIRIVLEVKGTNVFPAIFDSGERPFCQIIQMVALSLHSKLWQKEIMCGIVTCYTWCFFKKRGMTVGNEIKLDIIDCVSIRLKHPSMNMHVDSVQMSYYRQL